MFPLYLPDWQYSEVLLIESFEPLLRVRIDADIHFGQISATRGMPRLQLQRAPITIDRLLPLAAHLQNGAQIGVGVRRLRLQCNGAAIPQLRLGETIKQTKCIGHGRLQGIVMGRQSSSAQPITQRLLRALLLLQEVSCISRLLVSRDQMSARLLRPLTVMMMGARL